MKKRIISINIVFIFSFIVIIILSNDSSNKATLSNNGVMYAVTLDGEKINEFPNKGSYKVDVNCENANGKWLYDEWKLAIENIEGTNAFCDVNFTSSSTTYLNNYITSLVGTSQGDGKVTNEVATTPNYNSSQPISRSEYLNVETFSSMEQHLLLLEYLHLVATNGVLILVLWLMVHIIIYNLILEMLVIIRFVTK